MALNALGLGFTLSAKDMLSPALARASKNFDAFDKSTSSRLKGVNGRALPGGGASSGAGAGSWKMWGSRGLGEFAIGAGTMGVGLLSLKGAFAAMNKASEFQQTLAAVGAVAGASAKELDQLHDSAIRAGIATQFSPNEAAGGLRDLAQAGYSAKESIALLLPTLDLAAGSLGELDPSKAAGLMSQTLKAFSLGSDQAAPVADKLLQAANMFALGPGELPEAVGIASRGAQAIGQSLSETLISLGLVKNIIPGIERASTGVAVAMERMAKGSTQKAIAGLGVKVADNKGHFKDFLTIINELSPKLAKMTDKKRAGWVTETFGAHALGAIQAIMSQINSGVKDAEGNLHKGADAVAYLRGQFSQSTGTAEKFRDALLGTSAGQKKLLGGSLETLAIVIGEPLAKAFKPVVKTILDVVNTIIAFVQRIPAPVKEGIAKVALAVGAVVTAFGAFIALKAGIAALAWTFGALGLSLSGVLLGLLPLVAVFSGIGLVAWASWDKIKLFAKGMMQLFSDGGFTGQIREELNKTGNEGIKGFAIQAYVWLNRVKGFLAGVGEGFRSMWGGIQEALSGFSSSLGTLGESLGLTKAGVFENKSAFEQWAEAGKTIGKILGELVTEILKVTSALMSMISFVSSSKAYFDIIGGILAGNGGQIAGGIVSLAKPSSDAEGLQKRAGMERSPDWASPFAGGDYHMPAKASQDAQAAAGAIGAGAVGAFGGKGIERTVNTQVFLDSDLIAMAQGKFRAEDEGRRFGPAPVGAE